MLSDSRPIGVFDSGIGGLTVLRQLRMLLPHERYVYLGDTARVPYGNKSADTVRRYSLECTNFLLEHDVKLVVVACNTASALAIDAISAYVSVPVLGMIEPAAQEALLTSKNGHIGIIGTRATISSDAYGIAIHALAKQYNASTNGQEHTSTTRKTYQLELFSRPCPLFVPLVEEGWTDTPATRLIAETYLKPLLSQNIDTLVLGCTHYPLLSPLLHTLAPNVTLIDCGHAAARAAAEILGLPTASDTVETTTSVREHVHMYLTDYTPAFQHIAKEFLGSAVEEAVRTTLKEIC